MLFYFALILASGKNRKRNCFLFGCFERKLSDEDSLNVYQTEPNVLYNPLYQDQNNSAEDEILAAIFIKSIDEIKQNESDFKMPKECAVWSSNDYKNLLRYANFYGGSDFRIYKKLIDAVKLFESEEMKIWFLTTIKIKMELFHVLRTEQRKKYTHKNGFLDLSEIEIKIINEMILSYGLKIYKCSIDKDSKYLCKLDLRNIIAGVLYFKNRINNIDDVIRLFELDENIFQKEVAELRKLFSNKN